MTRFSSSVWDRLIEPRHAPAGHQQPMRLTLHLGLAGIAADAGIARSLDALSDKHFVPGCSPVVNLFKRNACPVEPNHTATD